MVAFDNFKSKLQNLAEQKNSKIILAIDDPDFSPELISKFKSYVVGLKIGILPIIYSSDNIVNICKQYLSDYVLIADMKIADIPYISRRIGSRVKSMGFDAVIAHAFVGADVLKELKEEIDTIGVVCMTNEGSLLLNQNYRSLVEICNELELAGLVAPATKPEILRDVRKMSKLPIFSPGIGAQGMPYGSALKNGADFEIIGRAILKSKDPLLEVKKALEVMRNGRYS
ncbi:MAG TPA: orotidine 5'-phosphate decarboxylase / HUMPS family protein [Geobacterales bacterium]|nr:orotidine 5'-phosphate decarboxylase / HUMPS family protein [Geobacterales bacterium]